MKQPISKLESTLDNSILKHYGLDVDKFKEKMFAESTQLSDFLLSDKAFFKMINLFGEPIWVVKNKKGVVFMFKIYLGFNPKYDPTELYTSIPNELKTVLNKVFYWQPIKTGFQVGKCRTYEYWELEYDYLQKIEPNTNFPRTIEVLEESFNDTDETMMINDDAFVKYYEEYIKPHIDTPEKIGMIDFETTNLGFALYDKYNGTDQLPLVCVVDEEPIVNDILYDDIMPHQMIFENQLRTFSEKIIEQTADKVVLYAYNKMFEDKVLRKLGLDEVADKLVDLAPPFRARMIYHKGSFRKWSLKHTHQLITGSDAYCSLGMKNGFMALVGARSTLYNRGNAPDFIDSLVQYCTVDTMIMYEYIKYYKTLYTQIKEKRENENDSNN